MATTRMSQAKALGVSGFPRADDWRSRRKRPPRGHAFTPWTNVVPFGVPGGLCRQATHTPWVVATSGSPSVDLSALIVGNRWPGLRSQASGPGCLPPDPSPRWASGELAEHGPELPRRAMPERFCRAQTETSALSCSGPSQGATMSRRNRLGPTSHPGRFRGAPELDHQVALRRRTAPALGLPGRFCCAQTLRRCLTSCRAS